MSTTPVKPISDEEQTARAQAQADARRQGCHLVLVLRGDAYITQRLLDLKLITGDVICALLSPYPHDIR